MATRMAIVGSAVGLHARPASLVANRAAEFDTDIFLSLDGEAAVDASSLMAVMALGAEKGAQVTVTSDSGEAVAAIADLIERDLDA
ncbi:HPr family phosphocarrier protein [Ancrocorticia populi]|uniref:Phosphocarrier protein HPr n=1 Tax=Ancrocorticia populi TaxID=2175228 RepID=A0A2V1KCJ3_9ACTO|nr:HPr family phosphocarrier protein [Ancrocorticia populi]PWF27227.1 HPr family phosphocarrier protein [Ancrocorticia populi]